MTLATFLHEQIHKTEQSARYRARACFDREEAPWVFKQEQRWLNFSSNDYLGLRKHPAVQNAYIEAATHYGTGSGAAAVVTGYHTPHEQAEQTIAEFLGMEQALLFPSGYQANLALLTSLLQREDTVLWDEYCHASLIDGIRYSGARWQRYRHLDLEDLREKLIKHSNHNRCWIITDHVFSMEGDIAPLVELAQLAEVHNAYLIVDDSHGIGVLGNEGRSAAIYRAQLTETQRAHWPVITFGLGKSMGTSGGAIAADKLLINFLLQTARPYRYSTSIAPAVAAATVASIHVMQQESWRIQKLQNLISLFHKGAHEFTLPILNSITPIQSIMIGDITGAMNWFAELQKRGIWLYPMRPPTVPENTARLRVTLTAQHTEEHIYYLLEQCHECQRLL